MSIVVRKPGLLTSVQDLGRWGFQRHGIVVGGAADAFAARVANSIVGNEPGAAVLEMAQLGPELMFESESLIAYSGGEFEAWLDRRLLPRDRALRVPAGGVVYFAPAKSGLRAWMAVAGGIDVAPVLGSRSTYRRAGIGGLEGRPLRQDDKLPVGAPSEWAVGVLARLRERGSDATNWSLRPETLVSQAADGTVRAVRGPEWAEFDKESQTAFFKNSYQVTNDADRMGARLSGPSLKQTKPAELLSSAVNTGVVQVPASGQPIVLLPSRQTVGGYPRIAAVAAVDWPRLAQLRPRDRIRFAEISIPDAHRLLLEREQNLNRARMGIARFAG